MKNKKWFLLFAGLLFVYTAVFAAKAFWAYTSGEQTSDALIFTGESAITGVTLISNDSVDPQIIVYDNTSATGTVVLDYKLDVSVEGFMKHIPFTLPRRCATGIYGDVDGTGASYIIDYIDLDAGQ